MTTRTINLSGSAAGKSFSGPIRRDGTGETNVEATLAAGTAGTLTTRTDNTTGTVTLPAGHGLTNGTYDVYWTVAPAGVHRGMTAVITSNSMALTLGAGDNLPAAASPVVVCKQTILDFDSDNASLAMVVIMQQGRASVQFQQTGGTAIKSLDLGKVNGGDGEPYVWSVGTDVANPFGSAISQIAVSNGLASGTNKITVAAMRS